MGSWFSSEEATKTTELNGHQTSIVVEEGMSRVDSWHTLILLTILGLLLLQTILMGLRMYGRAMKRKYLERSHVGNPV